MALLPTFLIAPNPKTSLLSETEKSEFFKKISDGVKDILEPDCKAIGWAINDPETAERLDYEYLALWQMPDKETVEIFEKRIQELGWFEHFKHCLLYTSPSQRD